jgi:aspartate racemase
MKTIGLIGGMSWESTLEYYRIINEEVKARLGGFHSGKILLDSVDFAEVEECQHQGRWDDALKILIGAGRSLAAGGAAFALLCTNTMHKLYNELQESVPIPLLHIADAAGSAIQKRGLQRVGLLGTKFTMEEDFLKSRLRRQYGLEILIPGETERDAIHRILYRELCLGEIKDASREEFRKIIDRLESRGAGGVILGCTEIPLLVKQEEYDIPLFDTTALHARAAVDYALESP